MNKPVFKPKTRFSVITKMTVTSTGSEMIPPGEQAAR